MQDHAENTKRIAKNTYKERFGEGIKNEMSELKDKTVKGVFWSAVEKTF